MMSGLSPDALCRLQAHLHEIEVSFDAIKKLFCRQQLREARSALNLYECAVSSRSFDAGNAD